MAGERFPFDLLNVEHKDGKPAGACHTRVLLPEGARRRIARIFKGLFFIELLLLRQLQKGFPRHIHLAAHLQIRQRFFDAQRDCADRAQVDRDILADLPIAPRGATHKQAVFIFQRNG